MADTTVTPPCEPDADPDKTDRPPLVTPFLLTLADRTTAEIRGHWPQAKLPARKMWPDLKWAWRNVNPDLTSTHGYRWPFPGTWAVSHIPPDECVPGYACPTTETGGLCLARTLRGSLSGDCRLGTSLICGYLEADVLGAEESKLRVRKAWVSEVIGTIAELTQHAANLWGANLWDANLRYADLRDADLRGADLRGADLRGADLGYANLRGANLRYADLRDANLRYANLWDANLRGADLWGANLWDANLRYADLRDADLRDAKYSQDTLWPGGFDPAKAGAVLEP